MRAFLLSLVACGAEPGGALDSRREGESAAGFDSVWEETAAEDSGPAPKGCSLTVQSSVASAPADGRPAATIRVRAFDAVGKALPDGTMLGLFTTSGRLGPLPPLVAGRR